jgi:anti-sigma factor RsiW
MRCDEAKPLLDAYLDRELEGADAARVAGHLETCGSCRRHLEERAALSRLLQRLPYHDAPTRLVTTVGGTRASVIRRHYMRSWAAVAAAVVVFVSGAFGVQTWQTARATSALADVIVARHVDVLASQRLIDVPSSDQHTVKPWFQGKLDFSPPVPDLSPAGFALAGGRVDRIGERPVAALVYKRRLHVINVFIWPAPDRTRARDARTIRGFHERHWTRGGMSIWAVSDVNDEDLDQFVRAFDST